MACAKAKAIENMISKNLIKKIKMAGTSWDLEGFMDKSKKARLDIKLLRLLAFINKSKGYFLNSWHFSIFRDDHN